MFEAHSDHHPPYSVFTPQGVSADEGAIQQIRNCLAEGDAVAGSLSADHHLGYSMPIGGSIAYENYISPSGVGYDIGCGNKAVATSLFYSDIRSDLPRIMDEVYRRIAFGVGQPNGEEVKDHPVFDAIRTEAPTRQITKLLGTARKQLGTVGAGNHYVDLFAEHKTGRIWIGVHFGSRGFGHKIASGFLALAQGKDFDDHPAEGEMSAPPTLLDIRGPLGYTYLEAMTLAGQYAYAGRDVVVQKVLDILGSPAVTKEVHNHHNFAWREPMPGGGHAWVVRKGATPLWPGQEGFVGASMAEDAVIIEGRFEPGAEPAGRAALWSAPHGAGRAMSRTAAAGKKRRRSKCDVCGWTQQPRTPSTKTCPDCGCETHRVWVQETAGKVNWNNALLDLKDKGIELRGGAADEAPEAYKRLPAVLDAHNDHVRITHRLRPIGVAMAGSDTYDPFKD